MSLRRAPAVRAFAVRAFAMRALVAAPIAVLLAAAAHVVGFGGEHMLGGADAGILLAGGIGGSLALAAAAVLWIGLARPDLRRAEATLFALLPSRGGIPATAAILLTAGFAAFALGEALEGHSPLGSWITGAALIGIALLAALGARRFLRTLAAGGVALAAALAWEFGLPTQPRVAFAPARHHAGTGHLASGRHAGRAPPPFA